MFVAWTDADAFCQWFGPDGFTCTVREMDVRPGGRACFDMVSADGTVFTNRFDYLEVVPVERLVLDHGSDTDDDPARFRVTLVLRRAVRREDGVDAAAAPPHRRAAR